MTLPSSVEGIHGNSKWGSQDDHCATSLPLLSEVITLKDDSVLGVQILREAEEFSPSHSSPFNDGFRRERVSRRGQRRLPWISPFLSSSSLSCCVRG